MQLPMGEHSAHSFVIDGMHDNVNDFRRSPATYRPVVEQSPGQLKTVLGRLQKRACVIVTDDFPAFEIPRWITRLAAASPVLVEKVDSNGLIPIHATDRIFRTARSFRSFREKRPQPVFPAADPLAGV